MEIVTTKCAPSQSVTGTMKKDHLYAQAYQNIVAWFADQRFTDLACPLLVWVFAAGTTPHRLCQCQPNRASKRCADQAGADIAGAYQPGRNAGFGRDRHPTRLAR